MSPFHPWLKRLEGKEVTVRTVVNDNNYKYKGVVILAERELTLIEDNGVTYLIRNNDIEYIEFDKKLFKRMRGSDQKGTDPLWRWFKGLEGKEVRISAPVYEAGGTLVKVDKDLVFMENYGDIAVFRIDLVREVSGPWDVFNVKSRVEFEEVE